MINQEQMNKYKQIEKQHSDFVVHCQNQIQQLQSQKQTLQANMSPLRPSFPSGQINELSPLGPRVPHPHRPVLPMISTPNGTQPPPPSLQPPSSIPFVGPSSVVNNFVQANPSPMPPFPAPFPNQPNFYPTNNAAVQMYPPLPPYASAMLPSAQMLPDIPSSEHAEPAPYFERPAGLMTTVIKLEDFDYNPIDPKEIKLPALEPPSERLLQALEAFYSPPTHEHPRNAEGWEKLGLYEFFKAKSQARKEYEINVLGQEPTQKDGDDDDDDEPFINDSDTSNMAANNNNDEQQKSFREKSPSPPKKSYKEFTEEKRYASSQFI